MKFRIFILNWKKNFLLEKIANLRKQLTEKFPIDDNVEEDAEHNVPDLEDVSTIFKSPLWPSF